MTLQRERELPAGWKWVKIGDVSDVVSGATPKTNVVENWDGSICWITPTDLSRNNGRFLIDSSRNITRLGYERCSTSLVPEGTVVMSSRAPIGHLGIAGTELCTNQGCKSFVPNSKIDNIFLYYYLKTQISLFQRLGTGTTFKEISKTSLLKCYVPLPPQAEQERIAGILNRVDEIKSLREEAYNKATELISSIFHDMAGKYTQQTELPAGWKWVKAGDLLNFQTGKLDSNAATPNGSYPFFTCSPETFRTDTYSFETECVLLAGNNAKGVFPIKYFNGRFDAYQRTYVIESQDTSLLINKFLFYVLHKQLKMLKNIANGTSTKFLKIGMLRGIKFALPPLTEQKRITERIQKAESIRDAAQESLRKIEELQASMLQKAFRGEI